MSEARGPMHELAALIRARSRMVRSSAAQFLGGSRLRTVVVLGLIVLFWLLMFGMFLDTFMFLRKPAFIGISDVLLDYLFAFFFASLLIMMVISNAIIAYTSLFRSEETAFLFSLPLHAENTFAYRGSESMAFSAWGMATLVVPMIVAYGTVFAVPWYFFPFALALAALFILFATELGAFLALVVAAALPRRKKVVLIAAGVVCAVWLAVWSSPWWWGRPKTLFTESGIKSIMDRIAFCQHWALPSRWISHGMLSAARADPRTAAFLVLMILSNILFLGLVTHRAGFYLYRRAWVEAQGGTQRRQYSPEGLAGLLMRCALFFLPFKLRQLVLKDLKTFLRDPTQWSQFLLFFGLLALYILNLPRFGVTGMPVYWHSIISALNLGATCLTLATLTSRFVFPQLSLEGRRIWITGLLPIRRTMILWGKFVSAAVGTFLISGALIALSDLLIGLPLWVLAVHMLVVLCVCCGLNGLAVGLGALYPLMGTDNPSKIVSSFGGTLNLICSIGFIALVTAPVVVPLHLRVVGALPGRAFAGWLAVGLVLIIAVSAAACVAPMWAGARAFAKMEF